MRFQAHRPLGWLLPLILSVACGSGSREPAADPADPDLAIRRMMSRGHVNGLAMAFIDKGQVRRVAAYGQRDIERHRSLTTETVVSGASLTQTAFAYMVLQLVDEGRLTLDTSMADLLPRPLPEYKQFADLAGDERWRALTPRIVLTHSTGLADSRSLEDDGKLRFHFEPGTRYGSSGEGFSILQLALEDGLGIDVGKEMRRRVFERFGMRSTSMTWRMDFLGNVADGHALDGTPRIHQRHGRVSAAGSMDTTIADQAKMWAGILAGGGLSVASRTELTGRQVPITSAHQFPTLRDWTDPRNAGIRLAAGLGLITFQDSTGLAFFKGGHDDDTASLVLCLEAPQRCVVLLSNDVRAERIFPDVVKLVLGETGMPWDWEYGPLRGSEHFIPNSTPE